MPDNLSFIKLSKNKILIMAIRLVIAGKTNCLEFIDTVSTANKIAENDSRFSYEIIELDAYKWTSWLSKLNEKYQWNHQDCPVVWTVSSLDAKAIFLGGASHFTKYCREKYRMDDGSENEFVQNGYRLVIVGEFECENYYAACSLILQVTLNHQRLSYQFIQKRKQDWRVWLRNINAKNNWHHMGSPIAWKEPIRRNAKICYIGGVKKVEVYCRYHYNLDTTRKNTIVAKDADSTENKITTWIVIAGKAKCGEFAQACLMASHIRENLPCFCYEIIEKSVLQWQDWLCKINESNNWHHVGSPLIWKELLMKGSKPYYIGGISEFAKYCNSYYLFDAFVPQNAVDELVQNVGQYKKNINEETKTITATEDDKKVRIPRVQCEFTICITGASMIFAKHLVSSLLDISTSEKHVVKISIVDADISEATREDLEEECTVFGGKVSRNIIDFPRKRGSGLVNADLLIVLDHEPFDTENSIGRWLYNNKRLMIALANDINQSALPKLRILVGNLGPACYNATILGNALNRHDKRNVVVATSDLGMEVMNIIADIADVPIQNIFCPPVWGFVGVSHLVDILNTIHIYNPFQPNKRFGKVNKSSLVIGELKPEMRRLEYLLYWDDTLWSKVVTNRAMTGLHTNVTPINKVESLAAVAKLWLLEDNPKDLVSLGVYCDGSFDLKFDGIFSQPSKLENGIWRPANGFLLPRDAQMKLPYLDSIAKFTMNLHSNELPKIIENKYIKYRTHKRNRYRKRQPPAGQTEN